jgi:hypothetical protein
MRRPIRGRRSTRAGPAGCGWLAGAVLASLGVLKVAAADEVYHVDGLDVRWDNTLRYTAAFRVFPRDQLLVSNPNWDDGDRNFDAGLISNRLDVLSELDVTDGNYGARFSLLGWYDTVYHQQNDNDSPQTFNPFSVPHDEFTRGVRTLHGGDVQLGDAFVFGNFDAGDFPLSFRAGRYALLWGESVFFGENSIAAGMAPTDVIRELQDPAGYAKQAFLPVWQASGSLQLTDEVSLSGYYQFAWRKDQLPGSGSYFSYADYLDTGGERIILSPGQYLYRLPNARAPDTGQFGLSLQFSGSEFTYGVYALRFSAKDPQIVLRSGGGSGTYQLIYPNGIELYGASFSTYLRDNDIAGELSVRRNMPLISQAELLPLSIQGDTGVSPHYAVGDTIHGQISSVTTFGASSLWQRADLTVELAANDVLAVTKNPQDLDPLRDRFSAAVQASFAPQYFEVMPALDISLPLGIGYGIVGNSSTDDTQNARSGNLELGISATYRKTWQGSLTFTRFLGNPVRQPLADRDFIALTMQRTF